MRMLMTEERADPDQMLPGNEAGKLLGVSVKTE